VLALYGTQYEHHTPFLLGVALGAYGASQALLQIPFGMLSDRIGRKPIILLGLIIFILGSVIAAQATNVYELIFGRFLQGGGAISGVIMALLTDLTSDESRTKAMATIGASIGISFSVAMTVGPLVANWGGVGAIFWITAALGVIGIAISTALLPELSKHIKAGKMEEALHRQNRAIEFALTITLPAAVGLIILGKPIVTFLFERGAFSLEDSHATGVTLAAFSLGLPAYVLVKILSTQFFARQDTKTPMKIAIAAVGLNFILNFLLIGPFSYVGLALATACAAWFNAAALGTLLLMKQWMIFDERFKKVVPRLLMASLLMGLCCYGFQFMMPFPKTLLMRGGVIGLWIGGGFISYLMASWLVGAFQLKDLQKLLTKHTYS